MRTSLVLILSLIAGAAAFAETPTALDAIKLLPRGEAKRLARIEAREGTPSPDRWYLIVHDPKAESGVHEYVVAGGELVASRTVSQFAEFLKPTDVIGGDALKIDSDRAAKIAQQYALANNATVATMSYALKKDGAVAAPLWIVICRNDAGKELGRVIITAGKGNVVSHDGFPVEPGPPPPPLSTSRPRTVDVKEPPEVRRAIPVATPAERKGLFERIGGTFRKVLPGRKPDDQ